MKTILVVDDEKDMVKLVDNYLSKDGYLVIGAKNGHEGIDLAVKQHPDLILLDIMLPKIDGWDVCKRLKSTSETAHIPIIMLTAKAQESDKILGLEIGADDYITKPFNLRELAARVKTVLRRFEPPAKKLGLKAGELDINYSGRSVSINNKEIELTNTEFNLLWHMANRPGRVISRDDLITAGRGEDAMVIDRTIDVHIASLRKKLGKYKNSIQTIRSVGYKFRGESGV